jgi:hypothetical protein
MPKESPEAALATSPDASAEPTPMSPKKMALILLAAIVVGLLFGVGGAMVLRKMSTPPAAPAAETAAPATGAPSVKDAGTEPAASHAAIAASAAAPAPSVEPTGATAPTTAPAAARAAGDMPIPVLTGAEIKERYNITRFVDAETDQLCYLAEPRASGMNGSLTCVQRPAHVSNNRGQ